MVIKRVLGWPFQYGGDEHSGWLPPGAAKPLPTPVRNVLLDIAIEGDPASGYLLIYSAHDGSIDNDDWYQTLADAEKAADEVFGVKADNWQSGQSHTY
jgi:hypothetical protein